MERKDIKEHEERMKELAGEVDEDISNVLARQRQRSSGYAKRISKILTGG